MHHPGIRALPRRHETGVGQQRLGRQMSTGAPSSGPDRVRRIRGIALPRDQRHPE